MIDLATWDLSNWIVMPHETLTTSDNIYNDEGTLVMGQRQRNMYPISSNDEGTCYNIYLYQTHHLTLGVAFLENDNINTKNVATSTFTDVTFNTIQKYTIHYESDGVYITHEDESILLTNRSTDTLLFMYTSASQRTDIILAITEQNGGGQ